MPVYSAVCLFVPGKYIGTVWMSASKKFRPQLDVNDLTALTAAQLIINFIGMLVHSGQIG